MWANEKKKERGYWWRAEGSVVWKGGPADHEGGGGNEQTNRKEGNPRLKTEMSYFFGGLRGGYVFVRERRKTRPEKSSSSPKRILGEKIDRNK